MQNKQTLDQAQKKIAHDIEDLPEGEEVIMTLQDQNILEGNNQISDKIDTLENVQLMDKAKSEFNTQLKENIKKLASQTTSHLNIQQSDDGNAGDLSKKILPHYNEIKFEKKGIMLDQDGGYNINKQKQLQIIKDKLKGADKDTYNLEESTKIIAQEYEQPKKSFIKKKNLKRQSKELLEYLEENANQYNKNSAENYSSREEQQKKISAASKVEEQVENQRRAQNYNQALEAASKQTQAKQEQQKKNNFMWEDDDEEIQLEIAKQKQILQQQKQPQQTQIQEVEYQQQSEDKIKQYDEKLLNIIQENASLESEQTEFQKKKDQGEEQEFNVPKGKKKGEEPIYKLTNTQDFLKRIETEDDLTQNKMKEMQPSFSLRDVAQGTRSVAQVSLPSEIFIGLQKKQEMEENKPPDMTPVMDENELNKLKDEVKVLRDSELNTATSVLQRLRENGALQNFDFFGRSKDEKPNLEEKYIEQKDLNKIGSNIKLEYKNQDGKIMTQKEAFRYMCYIFHGKGPGKKKLEKLKKKSILQEKVRQQGVIDNPMLKALQAHQQQTGQAFMTLQQSKHQD